MMKYSLHYAGSTFELRNETIAEELLAVIRGVVERGDVLMARADLLDGGSVEVLLGGGAAVAVSSHGGDADRPFIAPKRLRL